MTNTRIPGFRRACTVIGVVYLLLAGSIVARGAAVALAPYGLPPATLESPHFADAILWVYVHMMVLGATILLVGRLASELAFQRAFARLMLAAHAVYLFLDLRTSDSVFGNALYKGPESLGPAVIGAVVMLTFAVLSFVPARD